MLVFVRSRQDIAESTTQDDIRRDGGTVLAVLYRLHYRICIHHKVLPMQRHTPLNIPKPTNNADTNKNTRTEQLWMPENYTTTFIRQKKKLFNEPALYF